MIVERGCELVAGAPQELETRLPLGRRGAGPSLGGEQLFALALGALALADVPQEGLHILRLAGGVTHGRGLFPHPDNPAVTSEQAVLGAEWRAVLRLLELPEKPFAVLRVHMPRVDVEARVPVGRRVAGQLLDRRAHVERSALGQRFGQPRDEGECVEQRAIPRLCAVAILLPPAFPVARAQHERDENQGGNGPNACRGDNPRRAIVEQHEEHAARGHKRETGGSEEGGTGTERL